MTAWDDPVARAEAYEREVEKYLEKAEAAEARGSMAWAKRFRSKAAAYRYRAAKEREKVTTPDVLAEAEAVVEGVMVQRRADAMTKLINQSAAEPLHRLVALIAHAEAFNAGERDCLNQIKAVFDQIADLPDAVRLAVLSASAKWHKIEASA